MKHGKSSSRIYKTWTSMKQRCGNSSNKRYRRYGGRGIKICKAWNDSFIAFYNWVMSHGYRDNLQIDRRDNDGDYTPDNCRWITLIENLENRPEGIRYIEFQGERRYIAEWARLIGISDGGLRGRLSEDGVWKEHSPLQRGESGTAVPQDI